MLPPSFEHKSTHHYGTLSLYVNRINTNGIEMSYMQPHFFGNVKYQNQTAIDLPVKLSYKIATNLWHFYAYLTDCKTIPIILTDNQGLTYTSDIQLELMPSSQVLNKYNASIEYLFQDDSYLNRCRQNVKVFDRRHRIVGSMDVQIRVRFNEDINRVLYEANMVDFDNILVVEELSPLPSSVDLQNSILREEPPVPTQDKAKYTQIETDRLQQIKIDSTKKQKRAEDSAWPSNMPSQIEHVHNKIDDDEKMMEDDIDRMIAQMQNRPYDSSRYLENNSEPAPKQNVNYSNWNTNSAEKKSYQKLPPKYPNPTAMKTSHSPIKPYQPIMSYTMNTPMELNRTNYLMNSTGTLPTTIHNRSHSREGVSASKYEPKVGIIRLKIHELMVQRPESELSLILKLYINDSESQYYTTNSLKQGEAILFNSNIKIDQKIDINQLRFELIESYDMKTIYARGSFDMGRLYSQNPAKGIFMVNLITPSNINQSNSRMIRVEEQQVVKVIPNIKSLRIQLEYQEPLEIVQLYLCLSQFSSICKSCRYKIPLTKQTIQFRVNDLSQNRHMNVFPHNRSSGNRSGDKIIVELWGEKELIGFNEINLKPLYNTNQRMINSSLEPIYLYDENREVLDFKGSKTKGYFNLNLCYGTISQVQNLLNQNHRRLVKKQQPKKQILVESHLGIYIKQNKAQKEVQIQVDNVDSEPLGLTRHQSRKNELNLTQQQDLPEEDDEEEQFMGNASKVSQNQFLNKTMEEKYLKEQTVPIFNKKQREVIPENKATLKADISMTKQNPQKPLKSLTKQFQDLIKETFDDFQTQKMFQKLKDQCKDHLLYNFIEKQTLIEIFHSIGVSQTKINTILQEIILVSNDMININVLYDLVYGLILDGCVKEKYIDDYQLGRYCLSQFYKTIKEKMEQQLQDLVVDDNVEFQEARKYYLKVGIKLSMRQFKQVQIFMNKFLQNQSRMTYSTLKNKLLAKEQEKIVKQEQKKEYEQQVMKKLYNAEWDEDDDYFISNINQSPSKNQEEEQTSVCYQQPKNISNFCQPASTHIFQAKNSLKDIKEQPSKAEQPSINMKMNQSPEKHAQSTFEMTVQGFENCIQAAQCHLDIQLVAAKLKISYNDIGHPREVYLNREQNRKAYSLDLFLKDDAQFLDGSIQLMNSSKVIARCNYSIIKGVRSVYALKSINEAEFCGLIYLEFKN